MEITQAEFSIRRRLVKCYKEHLIIIMNSSLSFGPKISLAIQIYLTLQYLSILFISYGNSSIPWSCPEVDNAVMYMSVILRPGILAIIFDNTIINCIVVFILLSIEQSCNIITFSRIYQSHFYESWNENEIERISKSYPVKLLAIVRFLMYKLYFICIIHMLLEFQISTGTSESALQYVDLTFYLIFLAHDSIYLQHLSWAKSKPAELIAAPRYTMKLRLAVVLMILILNNVSYTGNYFIYALVFIVSGTYITLSVIFHLPYAVLSSNIFEASRGMILLWGGLAYFAIFIHDLNEPSKCSFLLLYLIPLPCMIFFVKEICRWRYKRILYSSEIHCLTQLFHILYNRTKRASKEAEPILYESFVIQCFQKAYKSNIYITYWMAQFFNEMKRYNSVRIMHAALEADPQKFHILSYISQARIEYLHKARKIPAESEAISYLTFSEDLERVLSHDELTCQLFFNLYNLLCSSKPESHHISKILTKLYEATNFTLRLYRYLNIKFSRNSKIANYYMGFKDFINMHDIKDNTHSVSQLVAHHKESSSKEQELQFFDLKSVVFFIDLETEIGKIIWVRNPEVIGYTEIELEHTSILSLFIEPISNVISAYLESLRDVWNEENVFQSRQQVYIKSHDEFLIPVLMKGSTVNFENGKLVLMMLLKPSLDGKEAAFMTDDGRFVRHATKDMSILLCRLLNLEPQEVNRFNILDYIEIDQWENEVEVYKEVDTRTKSTIILKTFEYCMLNISAKMLVLITNTDENLIHKVDFGQIAKRLRSIRICSVVDQKIYSVDVSYSHVNNPVSDISPPLFGVSEERLSASVQSASINIRNQTKSSLRSFTKRRAAMLKIGLFIYTLIVAGLCTVNVAISRTTVVQVTKNNQILQDFCDSAISMMKISIYGKELYLIDNGVDLKSSRSEVVEMLLKEANRLNSISHELTKNLILEDIKERLFDNKIEYYDYMNNIFIPIPYTLMDILNQYVIHAVEVAGVETISFETPSFLELFLNGYGRPRYAVNKIAYEIATDLEEIVDSRYQIIYYVLLGSIIAILFSVAFLKILPLYKFQQLRKDTWEHIFSIPMSTLILGLQQSRDRLFTVHGVEMNSSDVNANIQRKCSYKVDRKQIGLYMIVGLLVTGIGMYIFSVYWKLAPDRSQLLKDTINTNLYLKLKQSATWFNLFVLREKADMVQDSQDYIKGDLSLDTAISELRDIHYKSLEYDDVTDEIWDIYYDSYETYQYGYHSYTNYLTGKIHETGLLLSEGSKYLNIGGLELESEIKNYITATRDITHIYSKEFESLRQKYFNDFLGISIVVSIGTAVILLLIFKPLANNFKQQIEREIEILKYLPIYENIQ